VRWEYVKEILDEAQNIELSSYIFKSLDILKIDEIFLEIKFSKKTRVDLSFNNIDKEKIFFESKTPMAIFNKRVGLNKLENGISIVTISDITTLVEIKIEL
jgi:hypothetical protein